MHFTALHSCSWDDPAVLSVLKSEVLSGLSSVLPPVLFDWWSVLVQFCVLCTVIFLFCLSMCCAVLNLCFGWCGALRAVVRSWQMPMP
jgi:hypothetical protein